MALINATAIFFYLIVDIETTYADQKYHYKIQKNFSFFISYSTFY